MPAPNHLLNEDFVSLVLSQRVFNRYVVLGLFLYSWLFSFDYK